MLPPPSVSTSTPVMLVVTMMMVVVVMRMATGTILKNIRLVQVLPKPVGSSLGFVDLMVMAGFPYDIAGWWCSCATSRSCGDHGDGKESGDDGAELHACSV